MWAYVGKCRSASRPWKPIAYEKYACKAAALRDDKPAGIVVVVLLICWRTIPSGLMDCTGKTMEVDGSKINEVLAYGATWATWLLGYLAAAASVSMYRVGRRAAGNNFALARLNPAVRAGRRAQ